MRTAGLSDRRRNKMLHTIIDPYDIFYNAQPPGYSEEMISGVMTTTVENGKYKPNSFFSTNPADYLNKIQKSPDFL